MLDTSITHHLYIGLHNLYTYIYAMRNDQAEFKILVLSGAAVPQKRLSAFKGRSGRRWGSPTSLQRCRSSSPRATNWPCTLPLNGNMAMGQNMSNRKPWTWMVYDVYQILALSNNDPMIIDTINFGRWQYGISHVQWSIWMIFWKFVWIFWV